MKKTSLLLLSLLACAVLAEPAMAGTAPWESGLETLKASLTGPVASGLSLIGIVAAGAMLLFGGEISGFMKSVVYLVLVISLIIGGNKIINMVQSNTSTNATGALISTNEFFMPVQPAINPVIIVKA